MSPEDKGAKDFLALERTKLSNERTFLAYFRTFLVLLSSGLAIIKIEFLQEIKVLGTVLIVISSVVMLIGLIRLFYVRWRIRKYFKENP